MATAFAVYSADDNSLRFYKRDTVPTAGDTFEGLTVTAVYTGFETATYDFWGQYKTDIYDVSVEDGGIAPVSTAFWFSGCTNLQSVELKGLDTSSTEFAQYMFNGCSALKDVNSVTGLDTSSILDMSGMFNGCSALTYFDVSWDTSNVQYMNGMFSDCSALEIFSAGKSWDTSHVTDMSRMFENCEALTNVSNSEDWDTSSVEDMSSMFSGCTNLNVLGVSNWNTSSVANMETMFSKSGVVYLNLSSWDVSKVANINSMFYRCTSLKTLYLSDWDISKLENIDSAFTDCISLSFLDLSNWDTSSVTSMDSTFYNCRALTTLDLSSWNTSQVDYMRDMFRNCSALTTIYISNCWSTAAVTSSNDMFTGCTALVGQSGTAYDSSKVDATMANYETGYLTYKRYVKQAPYLIQNTTLYNIADAIRAKNGSTATMTPAEMATAIAGMQVDGIRVNTVGEGEYTIGYYADAACTVPLTESALYALLPDGDVWVKKGIYGPWATAPDSNVAAAIAAAQAGELDLSTIWSVGDTRKVQLSAMAATGVGESHVAQEVEIVLKDFQQLYDYTDGSGKCQAIWGLKNGLANGTTGEYGYMNSSNTNSGGWDACARRTWCNEVFYKSLPYWMQQATKQVNVITASGTSSTTATSSDFCFLPAEKEVFGSTTYANSTAESSLKQWTWYATSGNRIKKCGANGSADYWWERSPYSDYFDTFCTVGSGGSANSRTASSARLLAPSGCF